MNWKNLTIEPGFVKQEISINGSKAVNFIPVNQIDSFGVVSSENKKWIYGAAFFALGTLILGSGGQTQAAIFSALICLGLFAAYFLSRKTWLTIVSSQTKFSVQVITSSEEIQAVNSFVLEVKRSIQTSQYENISKAA